MVARRSCSGREFGRNRERVANRCLAGNGQPHGGGPIAQHVTLKTLAAGGAGTANPAVMGGIGPEWVERRAAGLDGLPRYLERFSLGLHPPAEPSGEVLERLSPSSRASLLRARHLTDDKS